MSFLQKHFKLLHINIAKVDLKLKNAKQKSHQTVNKIILYVEKLKIQLFEFSKKYQEYLIFFHGLHLYLKRTILKNRFEIILKRKFKKLIRRFKHTEILIEKNEKFWKFDSKKIKK